MRDEADAMERASRLPSLPPFERMAAERPPKWRKGGGGPIGTFGLSPRFQIAALSAR